MTVTGGRVVMTPGEVEPYKVVLEHEQTNDTEHAVASMREGEALIRSSQAPTEAGVFDFGSARETARGRGAWEEQPDPNL